MKNLTGWLNANKISPNVKKTAPLNFKPKEKRQTVKLRINFVENDSIPLVLLNILALELTNI